MGGYLARINTEEEWNQIKKQIKEEGKEKVILFNLSGHGLIDMASYDRYFAGELKNYQVPEEEIAKNVAKLEKLA